MEDIVITGSGSELQGVGRLSDGRAVFVPGALLGEHVRIEITRSAPRFCEARLVEVLTPSACRRPSACPAYGRCGGCQARHMTYEETLTLKRQRVWDALTRIGGLDAPLVHETIGCADPERTRNKAEFPIGRGADGRICIGAYVAGSHEVVPLSDCQLQKQPAVRALKWFGENLPGLRCAAHLTCLVTRVNRSGRMMLILCADAPILADVQALIPALTGALPELESLYLLKQNRRPSHALDGVCTHLWGAKTLDDTLLGLTFALSPQSFFQVNPEQTEVLYAKALEAAGLYEGCDARILDAYCGAGTITLAAARLCKHATGVEIVPPAIANAKQNAQRNGLVGRTRFICADAAIEIPRLVGHGERFDAVILDPPRKGAEEKLLQALLCAAPPRISYVSCNPATLARDVKILSQGGYRLQWAQPVDMFPWTGHVETVCFLSRVEGQIESTSGKAGGAFLNSGFDVLLRDGRRTVEEALRLAKGCFKPV